VCYEISSRPVFSFPFLPLHEPLYFPLAFDLLASLRARPIASIASCLSLHEKSHFCLPLGAAPPTTSLMGVTAAALSTDSAGQGL
jgi:hypothetical protein